ncbi:response regulator [Chitinophagaceae bacterium LB-8]|uniref:Response regulator n=1 Tax=Paraflavisolibacter caeni TaxID=2982496 RepID=A0A9X3B776_9BACT|nr:response regulator [Paraflavisolibacter caeni]MCU7548196.1 response regulator [Paraflavisolibacter caeni]
MFDPVINYKSILLIDDDEDDCYLFQRAVSKISSDIEFFCINSAEALWSFLENTKPSIIFIDLHLPKQNGLECLRLIRTIPSFRDIPVIFWSGSSNARNIALAYSYGAQYYFEKPCYINDLVDEISRSLHMNNEMDYPLHEALLNCQTAG